MQEKSSAIMVTLLAAGIVAVIAGLALVAVKGSGDGKLTFTAHTKPTASTSPGASGQKPMVAGASSAPVATAHPTTMPGLSPQNTIYPVFGTMVLSPAGTPVAGHEVDIVGSIPVKTFTNGQGHFTTHLPVGNYVLTLNPAVGPGAQSWPFTVARQPLTLNLTAQSGR